MTIASINNSIPDTSKGFQDYFNSLVKIPLIAQWVLTGILWVIGRSVHKSDSVANIEPAGTDSNQDSPNNAEDWKIKKIVRRVFRKSGK